MNMNLRTRLLLSSLLVLSFAPALLAAQPKKDAVQARHTLWKVQGKKASLHLLGSVHVLKPEDYPLPAVMESAFTNAATVVFEADLAAMEDPQVQFKILGKAQLPPGETLKEHVSPAVYKQFTERVQAAGLPAAVFDQFKPSLAAITLTVMEIQKLGFKAEHGVDKHYFDRARKAGKEIVALETVEFQVGLVTDFSKEEGELMMKTTLDEVDQMKKELETLIKAWKEGDSATLEKLLNEASRQSPPIYKRLMTDRNEQWVPKLEEMLRGDKSVLAIVGTGHLVGADSVVELLRKRGWKVQQL